MQHNQPLPQGSQWIRNLQTIEPKLRGAAQAHAKEEDGVEAVAMPALALALPQLEIHENKPATQSAF